MSQSSSTPPYPPAEWTDLCETDRHRLLASDRRRAVLDVLDDTSPPVDLEDLVAAVTSRDEEGARHGSDPETVGISLHHTHLPLLTEAGVIEYVPATKRVEAVHVIVDRP